MFSLGVMLVSVYVSFFRPPDLYWTGKTDWEPGAPTSENQLSEPGRNGLSPCFRIQAESRNQRAEIGDCLLLIPSRTALHTYQVELRSGAFLLAETDLLLPDSPPIIFTRSFRAWDPRIWPWPIPPFNLYDLLPTGSRRPYTYIDLRFPDGQALHYPRISPGIGYQDAVYEHTGTRGPFYGSRLKWNGNGWALKLRNGTVYVFPEAYYARRHAQGALVGIRDPAGKILRLERDTDGRFVKITSPAGHWLEFEYGGNSITRIHDSRGRAVKYTYDARGRLTGVENPAGQLTRYDYDDSGRLLAISNPSRRNLLRLEYDAIGRLSGLTLADGTAYRFRYTSNAYGTVSKVEVLSSRGRKTMVTLNASSYAISAPE